MERNARVISPATHRVRQPAKRNARSNVLALADFLAGDLASGTIARGDAERQVFINTFDLFAQDSWKLTQNLSVDYGIRYDYLQPMHSNFQNLSVFRPELTAE